MSKLFRFLAGIFLVVCLAGTANALTMDSSSGVWTGTTGGEFVNYDPGPGPSSIIRWGAKGWDEHAGALDSFDKLSEQSGLGFDGVSNISFDLNQTFSVGTLTHYNNPIYNGTAATEAFLTITLNFSELAAMEFNFTFAIDETLNSAGNDRQGDDDFISIPSSFASETFEIDGETYTLQLLGFGDSADDMISYFQSPEGEENPTTLWGKITAAPVPEPASMILFGLGLLGMASVGRRKKDN